MSNARSRLPTINPYEPQPSTRATPAATSSGTVKSPVAVTSTPVTIGANEPPTLPPKFCSEVSEDTMCGGATSIGIEFTAAVERLTLTTDSVSSPTASHRVRRIGAGDREHGCAEKTADREALAHQRHARTRPDQAIRRPASEHDRRRAIRNGSMPTSPVFSTDSCARA